jgi:hypothetical protein
VPKGGGAGGGAKNFKGKKCLGAFLFAADWIKHDPCGGIIMGYMEIYVVLYG